MRIWSYTNVKMRNISNKHYYYYYYCAMIDVKIIKKICLYNFVREWPASIRNLWCLSGQAKRSSHWCAAQFMIITTHMIFVIYTLHYYNCRSMLPIHKQKYGLVRIGPLRSCFLVSLIRRVLYFNPLHFSEWRKSGKKSNYHISMLYLAVGNAPINL